MGLEAAAELITDTGNLAVKALLESDALILRGAVKATLPRGEIANPHIAGETLLFEHKGQAFTLALPQGQAAKWLKKLVEAPPSLAAKLGIAPDRPVLVDGQSDDPALRAALDGAVTTDALRALQGMIIADTPEALAAGLAGPAASLPAVWIVYPKGAKSPLPESTVRSHLHALGYVDTKVAAVSQMLTAARFSKRK